MGIYKRGKVWYIDFYAGSRRKRERIGQSKKLAESVLNKRLSEVAENRFLDKKEDYAISLPEIADIYMRDYSIPNKKSSKRDRQLLDNLISYFGDMKLQEISAHDIEKYKAYRVKEIKKSTLNRELGCLKALYNKAIEWDYIDKNPVRKVKFFNEEPFKRQRYLNEEEIKKLLEACGTPYLRDIVGIALNTGMRLSPILNLEWKYVDFIEEVITLIKTKNNKIHKIPMNKRSKEILFRRKCAKTNIKYVFCFEDGINIKSVRTGFESAVKRAGIDDLVFHDLRHTFASHLMKKNVKLLTIKELLNHSTINMTLRYAHLAPNDERKAVNKLDYNRSQIGHKTNNGQKDKVKQKDDIACISRQMK